MRKLILPSLLFVMLFSIGLQAQNVILPFGSTWKYYDLGDEPPMILGLDFDHPNYDDSSWLSGPAQIGYGDGDEATVVTNPVSGTNETILAAYFRIDFTVNNPGSFSNYTLDVLYDDGAVAYLNGIEIGRVNMPGGDPVYSTLASSTIGNNAVTSFNIPSSVLLTGNNVLVFEVHNASTTSSDLSFDASIVAEPPITRGPYLQKLTSSSVVIKWRTSTPQESRVRFGLSPNTAVNTAFDATLKTDHAVEITGLPPNRRYFYHLMNGNDIILPPSTEQYFITAPVIGTVQPVTAWILGDAGGANNNGRNVRDAYYNYIGDDHTDMMLFLGDNAYNDGTDAQFQDAMFENSFEDILQNTVSWSCLGNHDGFTADPNTQSGPYFDIYDFPTNGEAGGVASGTEAYYSFDYANIHFIVLESYVTDRSVGGAMYNWAQLDIQNTTQDWIVAFWHHPAYTKGSHNSDTEIQLIEMRENFVPMLEQYGVDLILSGHSHSYERSYFVNGHHGNSTTFNEAIHAIGPNGFGDGRPNGDGIYQKDLCSPGSAYITTGSASRSSNRGNLNHPVFYYSTRNFGSTVMEVNGDRMDIKFIRDNGAIDDFFSIEKGNFNFPCDDGDPCTVNDVVDASCNCVGTLLPPTDSDFDGTIDCLDDCPNDPNKILFGICGCGVSDLADADSDGTADCIDGCPNDPAKIAPGPCGCGIVDTPDTDGDGTFDCNDLCPTDANKVLPGICGCGISDSSDVDGDGTPNCIDLCPIDANKIAPGICGCGVSDTADADNDGTIDCLDDCPNDSNKLVPGICGCGFSDTADTDNDGTIDCQDLCPTDPNKITPEICGCGNTEQDFDLDGTPNCIDLCPTDPNKIAGGVCGCGVSDTADADGDGTVDCNDFCPTDPNKITPGICGCGNVELDFNQDGICDTQQSECTFIDQSNFEVNSGFWTPGANGLDAERIMSTLSPNGLYSMRIRDNSFDNSSIFSNAIDLSQAASLELSFSYQADGFAAPQSFFFEFSNDGGATFTTLNEWREGTAFVNNVVYHQTVTVNSALFSSNCILKFRCNGNINSDQIFLDDIQVQICPEECEDFIIYTDNIPTLDSEEAIMGIETNRIVPSGTNINHNAGDYILMTPGFEVKNQGIYHAFIEACN